MRIHAPRWQIHSNTPITRSDERNQELIDERTDNDNSETYKTFTHNSKGVKADLFIKNTPHIDTLHCEINSAVWLKKIYVREIASSLHWSKKSHENELKQAEELLDKKLRQKCGLQRRLMQPGNYSRKLLSDKCIAVVISAVQQLIDQYRKLKKVWKSTRPLESCPSAVQEYRENTSAFMDTRHPQSSRGYQNR
ncbi:V(D)J recombination-activating protein 1-like [Amphiura filiformis]|uniref:V(D)J recombination-activating protein 1-like n=1 Tax=Amphiura filiformis TaxID=82378 RepID=UPI003B22129E